MAEETRPVSKYQQRVARRQAAADTALSPEKTRSAPDPFVRRFLTACWEEVDQQNPSGYYGAWQTNLRQSLKAALVSEPLQTAASSAFPELFSKLLKQCVLHYALENNRLVPRPNTWTYAFMLDQENPTAFNHATIAILDGFAKKCLEKHGHILPMQRGV